MRLLKFLTLGIGASEAVITGYRRPLGYQQIVNATLQSATGIVIPTVPAGTVVGYAVIQAEGGTVRWRDDGTDPTSTVGMILLAGSELDYVGQISALRFIAATDTPILDISLYS